MAEGSRVQTRQQNGMQNKQLERPNNLRVSWAQKRKWKLCSCRIRRARSVGLCCGYCNVQKCMVTRKFCRVGSLAVGKITNISLVSPTKFRFVRSGLLLFVKNIPWQSSSFALQLSLPLRHQCRSKGSIIGGVGGLRERWRREPLVGVWGHAPPEKFEI